MAPSPLIGTFNAPRSAASPGPNTSRPQTSRAQQNVGQTNNSRQRPSSSASNRINQPSSCKLYCLYHSTRLLTSYLFQPKPRTPDLQLVTDLSKTNSSQAHVNTTRLADESQQLHPANARTWKHAPTTLWRQRPAKDETRRPQHQLSQHSPSPPNPAHGQAEIQTLHHGGMPRRLPRRCRRLPRTKSRCTTRRTMRASLGIVTAMKLALVI